MTELTGRVVEREEWIAARREFLAVEKEFTRRRDEVSRLRRELPRLELDTEYTFEGEGGRVGLADLFAGHGQLLIYHFMFGPGWGEGCPSCSFWADNYDGTGEHLAHRDTSLVAVSSAPLPELLAYRERMGWSFPWYSSAGSSFNHDLGVTFTDDQVAAGANYNYGTQTFPGNEAPGISVFAREGERVFLTYQTFSRGLDMLNGTYHMLDLTPKGRDEAELEFSMAWLRRHDAYED